MSVTLLDRVLLLSVADLAWKVVSGVWECWEGHICAPETPLLCFETMEHLKGNFDYKVFQVLDVPIIMENRSWSDLKRSSIHSPAARWGQLCLSHSEWVRVWSVPKSFQKQKYCELPNNLLAEFSCKLIFNSTIYTYLFLVDMMSKVFPFPLE